MNPVVEAVALLTPYEIDIPKRRLGPNGDGGYIFADRLSPEQTILSYGISYFYELEAERAAAGHSVYMFDHTIEGINRTHPNMLWHREGCSGVSRPSDSLFSVEDHLKKYNIKGDRLILKMDVEGAEFEAIGLMPEDTLLRFEQIVVELHGIKGLVDPTYRSLFVQMLTRLNRHFTLFHVHPNNFDVGPPHGHPADGIVAVSGIPVSNLLECSFIRTNIVSRGPNQTLYPTPLDFPCMKTQRDKLLWFFPFLPTSSRLEDFGACEDKAAEVQRAIKNK